MGAVQINKKLMVIKILDIFIFYDLSANRVISLNDSSLGGALPQWGDWCCLLIIVI